MSEVREEVVAAGQRGDLWRRRDRRCHHVLPRKHGAAETIIESDAVAAEASGSATGLPSPPPLHISDDPTYKRRRCGFDMHLALAGELSEASGVDDGSEQSRRVTLAVSEAEEALSKARIDRRWLDLAELYRGTEWIDGGDARYACWNPAGPCIRIATRWH